MDKSLCVMMVLMSCTCHTCRTFHTLLSWPLFVHAKAFQALAGSGKLAPLLTHTSLPTLRDARVQTLLGVQIQPGPEILLDTLTQISCGTRTQILLDTLTQPGGVRAQPPKEDLQHFVEAASTMDGLKMGELMIDKLVSMFIVCNKCLCVCACGMDGLKMAELLVDKLLCLFVVGAFWCESAAGPPARVVRVAVCEQNNHRAITDNH